MTKQDAPTTTDAERAAFEATFSKAPYEFDMARWRMDDPKAPWPGNYKRYNVQCAWEGYQVGASSQAASASSAAAQPDTAPMYKALQDAYVVLIGINCYPHMKSFASEKAQADIEAILHAVPLPAPPAKPADTGEASNG